MTIESATQSQEIFFNPATGTFDGTVLLDAGSQTIVARAFVGPQLVGQSNPTAVDISPGIVTRVVLRILDVTAPPPPLFGPILDSLVHPTTTEVNTTVTFALAVVAPSGSPVDINWSVTGCTDSTFTAPTSAVTGWSKATPGGCTIRVTATSNGFTLQQTFAVAVFPDGAATGGADVTTEFVSPAQLDLSFFDLGCHIGTGAGGNQSCAATAGPAATQYSTNVFFWGNSTPGTLEVFDDCGGTFGVAQRNDSHLSGHWLPPTGGGLCIITVRAVNGDGVVATRSAAILARPGPVPVTSPPQIFAQDTFGCFFNSINGPAQCGFLFGSTSIFVFASINWLDGHPGSVTVSDNCGNAFPPPQDAFNFNGAWTPSGFNTTCTLTIDATSLEGQSASASSSYQMF